jgi:hypothetical protein
MKVISKWIFGIFSILILVGFTGLVLWLLGEVFSGHGNEAYISGRGYQWTPIAALSLMAIIPIVGLAGWYFHYRQKSIEKDFIKKYGDKDEQS